MILRAFASSFRLVEMLADRWC